MSERRSFTAEFKAKVVLEVVSGHKNSAECWAGRSKRATERSSFSPSERPTVGKHEVHIGDSCANQKVGSRTLAIATQGGMGKANALGVGLGSGREAAQRKPIIGLVGKAWSERYLGSVKERWFLGRAHRSVR